jgi:hypothetical protein
MAAEGSRTLGAAPASLSVRFSPPALSAPTSASPSVMILRWSSLQPRTAQGFSNYHTAANCLQNTPPTTILFV